MNRTPFRLTCLQVLTVATALLGLAVGISAVRAQTTAFTYQGQLKNGGTPANGNYDLTFTLFNTNAGSSAVSATITNSAVAVSNGLFSANVDFGPGMFPGADRWLEIAARTNGGGAFTILAPRQKLTSAPYAVTAGNLNGPLAASQLTGTLPGSVLSGTYSGALTFNNAANQFSGNGGGLTNLNATTLEGFGAASFWLTGGNGPVASSVLGSSSTQPLQLMVGNRRALQLEIASVILGVGSSRISANVIGGSGANAVSNGVFGGTIGGGGNLTTFIFGSSAVPNIVSDHYGTVGGGLNNVAGNTNSALDDAAWATVSGGASNIASGVYATVSGGLQNSASETNATVAGGWGNRAVGWLATIGGGDFNYASGPAATISGGEANLSMGHLSTIAGGFANWAPGNGSFIGGGGYDGTNGNGNSAIGALAAVTGGIYNSADGYAGMVAGGISNAASGITSFAAGYRARADHDGAFVWADSQDADFTSTANNQFNIRAAGGLRVAGAGGATRMTLASNGQLTVFGTSGNGVQGNSGSLGASGVYGENLTGGGFGVAGRASGVGYAVYGDNLDTNGWAGYFNGKVRCTTLTQSSDRNAKQDLVSVNAREVLAKVARLPIAEWKFKADPATRHLGPMAQDFYAAFALGGDEKSITSLDADGVALAAIQGLNQKVEEKENEIQALKTRLADLEKLVSSLARKQN